MRPHIEVQPLPHKTRKRTFLFLVFVFVVSLPFLYLYATGYRFDFGRPLVSTGGIYVAVERSGADIYIDGELVRETRTFKRAFYAQNLDAGTHRVHVQKEGYHTWVKELPVSERLVTEAEAFNLPLVPQVRVITEWATATGTPVVRTPLLFASTTQTFYTPTTTATSTYVKNREYETLMAYFGTTTKVEGESTATQLKDIFLTSTSTETEEELATSTIVSNGVELARAGDEVLATWVGPYEQMPYYYCAPDFPAYSTTTPEEIEIVPPPTSTLEDEVADTPEVGMMGPVQTIPKDVECDPRIRIDRKWQDASDFDFYPGSTDFVIMGLSDGVYVVEVDDRSWQNVQPLLLGNNLAFHVENGSIYIYDGRVIYQVLLQIE